MPTKKALDYGKKNIPDETIVKFWAPVLSNAIYKKCWILFEIYFQTRIL